MKKDSKSRPKAGTKGKSQNKPFDSLLEDKPKKLTSLPKRIVCRSRSDIEYVIELKTSNRYHKILFCAFYSGLTSDWLQSRDTKTIALYQYHVSKFFNWLSDTNYKINDQNRYQCLKDYEEYRMEVRQCKRSPLNFLKKTLTHGLSHPYLTLQDINYIGTLTNLSNATVNDEAKTITLTDWFSIPWLSRIIGKNQYAQLESPRRIITSFRITVAVTLSYILDLREEVLKHTLPLDGDTASNAWYARWNRQLINRFVNLGENNEPKDDISEAILLDTITPRHHKFFRNEFSKNNKITTKYIKTKTKT